MISLECSFVFFKDRVFYLCETFEAFDDLILNSFDKAGTFFETKRISVALDVPPDERFLTMTLSYCLTAGMYSDTGLSPIDS